MSPVRSAISEGVVEFVVDCCGFVEADAAANGREVVDVGRKASATADRVDGPAPDWPAQASPVARSRRDILVVGEGRGRGWDEGEEVLVVFKMWVSGTFMRVQEVGRRF